MLRDFAAIDFETANEQLSSICSIGIVVVRNGVISDRFYTLQNRLIGARLTMNVI